MLQEKSVGQRPPPQWIFIQEVLNKVQKKVYNSLEDYSEDPQKLQKLFKQVMAELLKKLSNMWESKHTN